MALMTKIRERMTTAFAVFAGLFIIYIVLDWGMDITNRQASGTRNNVGVVYDREISYEEFSLKLQQAIDFQKQQMGSDLDENQIASVRDQVWDQIINETLMKAEAERLGIVVTDIEIDEWLMGENPPDFLIQQFTDSTGVFNRDAYSSALKDPRNKDKIVQLKISLKESRLQEKVMSTVTSSVQVNGSEVRQKFEEQNIRYDIEFALFEPNDFDKDTVGVTKEEMQKFLDEHSYEYRQDPTRKVKNVVFKEVATFDDTNAIFNDIKKAFEKIKSGRNFFEIQSEYSETQIDTTKFLKHGEISPEREIPLFAAKVGDIVGPSFDKAGFYITKILEEKKDSNQYVRASHILINLEGDTNKQKSKANEILKRIKSGESFEKLAREFSQDPGSGQNNGDLGWFGKGRMVPQFEDAAFKLKVGEISGLVRSQFGIHIIKLTGRDNRMIRVSDIVMNIKASSKTRNIILQQANSFLKLAKEIGFDSAASQMKLQVNETPSFVEKSNFVPGIGQNPKVVRFAFKNNLNDISDVVNLAQDGGYGIFQISEVREEGPKAFEEIEVSLKARTQKAKKMEKLKPTFEKLVSNLKPNDSLGKLTSYEAKIKVQKANSFTLSSAITGFGKDPIVYGTIAKLKVGEISKLISTTNRGFILVKLLSKTPFDENGFKTQKENLRKQIYATKRNKFQTEWLETLKKNAEIEDNRDLFF